MTSEPVTMFSHRLAMALGMTVGDMKSRMGASEFMAWMAYDRLEPIGPQRDDWRIGQLSAMFYNANRAKGASPKQVSDFMYRSIRRAQTATEMVAAFRAVAGVKR